MAAFLSLAPLLITKQCLCQQSLQYRDLKDGQYLNENYSSILKKTKSPSAASVGNRIVAAHVEHESGRMGVILNFHEGISVDYTQENCFDVLSKTSFILKCAETGELPVKLFWVNDMETYLSSLVLAGSYRDQKGRHYVFNDKGKAIFPKETMTYQVDLDTASGETSFPVLRLNGEIYKYQFENSFLKIFKTHYDSRAGFYSADSMPTYILERQK